MGRNKKNQSKDDSSILKTIKPPKLHLSNDTKRSISILVFVLLAAVSVLSLIDTAGVLGQYLFKLFALLFGIMAYLMPIFFLLVAWILFQQRSQAKDAEQEDHPYARTYVGVFLIAGGLTGLVHAFALSDGQSVLNLASQGKAGGYLGALFAGPALGALGFWAGGLVLITIVLIGLMIALNLNPLDWFKSRPSEEVSGAAIIPNKKLQINEPISTEEVMETESMEEEVEEQKPLQMKINMPAGGGKVDDEIGKMESITIEDRRDWKLPPFDLLEDNQAKVDSGNIESNVAIIQKTLSDFGIEVEMGEVNVGPTVTQYTLRPSTGVKLSQIASLQNDLALSLAAQSIRMELPIPGKALVGIEVPNRSSAIVRLREVMQTSDFVNHKSKLALALGRDVAGRPQITDLAKMPHMLIAGATGTGKSVAINSLFISLLYRNTPQDIKFIVVDPKRVELSLYNGIPHLLTPSISEPDKAVNALKWAVAEMDRRYKMLAEVGNRNISEYNENTELKLPYIVIIVDELADLMAVAQADVESAIVRLAQMARAVGIHLVLATQRPSVEVITGLIKANITSRVAFAVASQIDSRTIIDSSGAEKLLGNGDMLFVSAESNKPRRVQGAYIGEKEVRKVVDFFKQQTGAVIYNEEIVEKPKRALGIPGMDTGDSAGDELFEEAKAEVMRAGKASASLLQRRLRVGYARAARLLDILEENGIVGPADGAKPREVYGVSESERSEYGNEEEL